MKPSPTSRLVLTSLALTSFLAAATLALYGVILKAEAASLLTNVSRLRVGRSTLAEVERLAEKHRKYLVWERSENDRSECSFRIRNTWLSYLHIEPVAHFDAWVTVNQGTVQSLHVSILRDTRIFPTMDAGGIVEEYIQFPEYYRMGDAHYGFPTPAGKPYLLVVLDHNATAEQREHAYALSLLCLVKPWGGCDLPCDYLPLAWKDWKAELCLRGYGLGEYDRDRGKCR